MITNYEVKNTKLVLLEASDNLRKFGYDMIRDFPSIVTDKRAFNFYAETLAEDLDPWPELKDEFIRFSESIREGLLENSMYNFYPQARLVLPLFRKFWPKLVARQAVTVYPMEASMVVYYYLNAMVRKWDGTTHSIPSTQDVTSGPEFGFSTPFVITPGVNNILAAFGLTEDQTSIEKDLKIVRWQGLDSSGAPVSGVADVVGPDDDGNFHAAISVDTGVVDFVSGHIDYGAGTITFSTTNATATNGKVTALEIQGHLSLEQNLINPRVKLELKKTFLTSKERKVSADWTTEFEQDTKVYFDIDAQAEFVNIFGNQIAEDIDGEILRDLINQAVLHHPTAISDFNVEPQPTDNYVLGPKQWIENVIPKLNELSSKIYRDTNIGSANILIGNPIDVALFESLSAYRAAGNAVDGASLGKIVPDSGSLAGKWTVLSTPVMPEGKLLVILKPEEIKRAVYVYGVYRPLVISPFPIGPTPSITMFSRYATLAVRPEGIGLLNLIRT